VATLLLKNADLLVTMDDARRRFRGGCLTARDGVIEQVGTSNEVADAADCVVDARSMIVLPG
jgi:cytosine/adenosine deaminase-related metal-dependent hydrolase